MEILTSKSDFVFADSKTDRPATDGSAAGNWQQQLKMAVRSRGELLSHLDLLEKTTEGPQSRDGDALENYGDIRAVDSFPVFVPLPYLSRIRPGDPNDPLLRQVLPRPAEDQSVAGYVTDPLGESAASRGPGLLQKYDGRVLLVTTGACAINCRYCFRRHFPYEASPKTTTQWTSTIQQIADDSTLTEVILSGGDPLMLVDESFAALVQQLDSIEHLQRLRIHTRLPIMIPDRINQRFLKILTHLRLQTVMVIHANHANELDGNVAASIVRLADAGVMLLNQSVLLRGVNDDAEALIELSERLLQCRVVPYYLHKNDAISGTAHFEVSVERGIELIAAMRAKLPGYAVPRFVQEIAGEPNKTLLA